MTCSPIRAEVVSHTLIEYRLSAFFHALKFDLTQLLGPTLGIMQGEWRMRAIADGGDEYYDFAYERVPGGGVVPFDRPKRDRIRLYLLNLVARLVERERQGGEAALADLANLLRRRDPIDDPRTVLFSAPDGPFETTTRDVVNTDRALWIKAKLSDEKHPLSVLEIGAGYGHQISHLIRAGVAGRAVIVDRPLNLIVARRYLGVQFPGRVCLEGHEVVQDPLIRLIPPWAVAEVGEPVDMLLNCISFQHMSDDVLRYYDKALRRLAPRLAVLENADAERIVSGLAGTFDARRLVEVERETTIVRPTRIDRVIFKEHCPD